MNKRPNPFFPQQAAYSNPPLPPGLPPQQPQQYDYSAHWAAAQAAHQPGHPQLIPQWTPPQPTPGPSGASSQVPANQTSLYANYGYGGQQNFNWQRPAQQPPRQPFAIPQGVTQPSQPYFSQHPPPTQPGRAFPSQAAHSFPQPSQPYRPQQPMFQQQPPPPQHTPPHLPPAKRPRFEGPPMAYPASIGSGPSGSGHGIGRAGSNGLPNSVGTSRGGGLPSGPGARGAALRGRGGTMGIGGGPSIGMMRGGALTNTGTRGGRGGHGSSGRGSHNVGQSGGHRGGRGGWHNQNNHNRRGASGSGRGRGSAYAHTNHPRDGGVARFNAPSTLGEKDRSGKKEEVRQTLTDFRIIGLEIESLQWRWGSCTTLESVDDSNTTQPVKSEADEATGDPQLTLTDGVEEIEFGSAVKDTDASAASEAPVPPPIIQSKMSSSDSPKKLGSPLPGPPPPSPPRIRIYFNTPASLDDSHLKVVNGVSNVSVNRAKRKLSEEEEEEGRRRRTKLNPTLDVEEVSHDTQSKAGDVEKDRGSVAPSVDMSATASISGRTEDEGDWLMEAIGRDVEATEDGTQEEHVHQPAHHDGMVNAEVGGEGPDEEIAEPNHVEDNAPRNDTVTPLGITVDIVDTGNQGHITVNGEYEEKEVPVPESASAEPVDDLPAAHVLGADEDDFLPQDVITEDTLSHKPAASDLHVDSGPEPEPPASPASQSASQQSLSQTLHSSGGSFSSLASPSNSQATTLATSSQIPGLTINETVCPRHRLPSANRVSISYASGARRLLIDAQVVETMKIWRGQGRIEVELSLEREGDMDLKGLLAETYSQASQSYHRLQQLPTDDGLLPPLSRIVSPSKTTLTIYLDKDKPMTEPRWVKTGDIEEWLRNTFGIFWVSGDDGWEKRIEVVDPDPPPTIHTVLENWSNSSLVGLEAERQRFVKTHMSESDNMLEILLRLVRGERATPISFSNTASSPNLHLSGPLLTALSPNSPHASQQTHLSLAIVAMVRMAESFADRAMSSDEDKGKREVDEKVGEIIRCLPQHLLHKSLDGIFREWKEVKKRGGRG